MTRGRTLVQAGRGPGQSNSHSIRRTLPVNQLHVPRRVPDTGRVSLLPPDRCQTNKIFKDRRRPASEPARRRPVREKPLTTASLFPATARPRPDTFMTRCSKVSSSRSDRLRRTGRVPDTGRVSLPPPDWHHRRNVIKSSKTTGDSVSRHRALDARGRRQSLTAHATPENVQLHRSPFPLIPAQFPTPPLYTPEHLHLLLSSVCHKNAKFSNTRVDNVTPLTVRFDI